LSEHLLYKTFIEQVLINALREEGIVVSTRTAIDISRVITANSTNGQPVFAPLKFQLTPLISRNKEEQEIVHSLFDTLDKKIADGKIAVPVSPLPVTTNTVITKKKTIREKINNISGWKKVLALLIVMIAIVWIVVKLLSTAPPVIVVDYNRTIYQNEEAVFTAHMDSSRMKNYSVDWKFADSSVQDSWSVRRVFNSDGQQNAIAYLKKSNGKIVDSDTISFEVKCEREPSMQIIDISDSLKALKKLSRNGAAYAASFAETKPGTSFSYQWFENDKPAGTDSIFTHTKSKNQGSTIRLVAYDRKNMYCSIDSLTAETRETENISAIITGDNALSLKPKTNWKNIALSLVFLIVFPAIVASALFYALRKRQWENMKKKVSPAAIAEVAEEGPFDIEFESQEHLIESQSALHMLADTLRKRQVSDIVKLNMRKTINATIRAGGMPQLTYVPLTKPTDFLVLIDKDNDDILLTHLYDYLLRRLQKEQVYITVYEFEKEPLLVSNQQLHHFKLPIDRLTALYPGTTLFVFGDSRHFISPLKGKLKSWVEPRFSSWTTKMFITPYPKQDWDKREALLAGAGFFIIPADLSAQPAIDLIINKQADPQNQDKLRLPPEYTSRYLHMPDVNSLKAYLQNDDMLLWVCSLAVYAEIDWNFTIAVGKALEKRMQEKNHFAELVTYTNLLKLARISWMRDGIVTETLRAEMLDNLDNETEALSRQTLLDQLENLQGSVKNDSLIKRTYDINQRINELLLQAYKGKRLPTEQRAEIAEMISNNELGTAEEIYLNKAKNTLLKHPYTKKSLKPLAYLRMLSRHEKMNFLAASLAMFAVVMLLSWWIAKRETNLLQWKRPGLYSQAFKVLGSDLFPGTLQGAIKIKENTYQFSLDTSTTQQIQVGITDTSEMGDFTLSTSTGQIIAQSSLKLNSNLYSIELTRPARVPVYIYYDTATDRSMVQVIRDQLPSNYNDSVIATALPQNVIEIVYTNEFENDARLVDTLIRQATGLNVRLAGGDTMVPTNNFSSRRGVSIFINLNQCTPIRLADIPRSLYEIWHGGSGSNRLLNFDSRQTLYYSTGNKKTYGTYHIEDICLLKNGTYKFITRADKQYKVFLIRNITAQSFELSVCQNLYNTKAEAGSVDESYCDRFNKMTLNYDNNRGNYSGGNNFKLFLPVSSTSLETGQRNALNLLAKDNVKYTINVYSNTKLTPALTLPKAQEYLRIPGLQISEVNDFSQLDALTPFDRSYIAFASVAIANPPPDRNDLPKCDITFYSIDETRKEKGPHVICKLDLSKQQLTTLPKEIESFVNLQELTLGETAIPKAEIDVLQKKLPKCNIRYTIKTINPPPEYVEANLGQIKFKGSQPDPEGMQLLSTIAQRLRTNSSARIRIEGIYSNARQQKILSNNIQTIKNLLAKNGIEGSAKIAEKMINAGRSPYPNQQQQQQQQRPTTSQMGSDGIIQIIGINYY